MRQSALIRGALELRRLIPGAWSAVMLGFARVGRVLGGPRERWAMGSEGVKLECSGFCREGFSGNVGSWFASPSQTTFILIQDCIGFGFKTDLTLLFGG